MSTAFLAIALALLNAHALHAQPPQPDSVATLTPAWRWSLRSEIEIVSSDNVFLTETQRLDRPMTPSPGELISGRYADMLSSNDLIATMSASIRLRGTGFSGRHLEILPSVRYDRYGTNVDRSNLRFGLQLRQSLGHGGTLRLRAQHQPSYFARNYFSDAVDLDDDGEISASERRYARGNYAATSARLDWRHRLRRDTRRTPLAAFLEVGIGLGARRNVARFRGRDLRGPSTSAALSLEPRSGPVVRSQVSLAWLTSPVLPQVIILNERVFDEDLNGNGNARDRRARVVRPVDRSRRSAMVAQSLAWPLARRAKLELSVDYRVRTFTSNERYDVANNGRRDKRWRIGTELTYPLASTARLQLGARYANQSLNRRTDLGAEGAVDDYDLTRVYAGLSFTP